MEVKRYVDIAFFIAAFLFAYVVALALDEFVWAQFGLPTYQDVLGVRLPYLISVGVGLLGFVALKRHRRFYQFSTEVANELMKVVYPPYKETATSTVVVIVMLMVVALLLAFVFDGLWGLLIETLLS